ncbi:TBC1 domain family member 14 isoform X1, partial [Tachysurus ichikawai]
MCSSVITPHNTEEGMDTDDTSRNPDGK